MAKKAGEGDHRVYNIPQENQIDKDFLTPTKHYIRVVAVSWYLNKKSGWFNDRTASGTIKIILGGGVEEYNAALGTFELDEGAKIAPVFERPVLRDRNYRGGSISIHASIRAIKKSNAIGSILRSVAKTSLEITSGIVETATIAGPAQILSGAGKELVGGVNKLLTETGEGREVIFDAEGIQITMQPEQIKGPETYLLFHRGSKLDDNKLKVVSEGQISLPQYEESYLEDGAWLLLKIKRSNEYKGVRDWFIDARKFRSRCTTIVNDVVDGLVSKEDALNEFIPTTDDHKSLADEYLRLRSIIFNDGVLTEAEASIYATDLRTNFTKAKDAINNKEKEVFTNTVKEVKKNIGKGTLPEGNLGKEIEKEINELVKFRKNSLYSPLVNELSISDMVKQMSTMKNALEESSKDFDDPILPSLH